MKQLQVAVGMVVDHQIEVGTFMSIFKLLAEEQPAFHGRMVVEKGAIGRLDRGRNNVIRSFGTMGADWLLFIDSDMVFTPADFRELSSRAHADNHPILSGLYFNDAEPPLPVAFDWDEGGRSRHTTVQDTPLQQVAAVGMGFLLVHMGVFNALWEHHFNDEEPWCDNSQLGPAGQPLADDMSFCYRATQCGYSIEVVTSARIGHIKSKVVYG